MTSSEIRPGFEQFEQIKKLPDINKALEAAVGAIYFDDSSDYETALWSVINALDPELAKRMKSGHEDEQTAVYDEVKKRIDPDYKP